MSIAQVWCAYCFFTAAARTYFLCFASVKRWRGFVTFRPQQEGDATTIALVVVRDGERVLCTSFAIFVLRTCDVH